MKRLLAFLLPGLVLFSACDRAEVEPAAEVPVESEPVEAEPIEVAETSSDGVLIDGADWELVAEGFEMVDGLCSDRVGNLYFSDVKGGDSIYRVDSADRVSQFIDDAAGISGLCWGSNGHLYACIGREKLVAAFFPDGAKTELVNQVQPNDLVVAGDGTVYFTMTPKNEIRRIDPTGVMSVVSKEVVERPNGITLSPDQETLAVSAYSGLLVWTFPINEDGSLGEGQSMEMIAPNAAPDSAKGDGMTTDAEGRYYVTSARGVQVFSAEGERLQVIPKPDPKARVISAAFAGPEFRWLYVASKSKIFKRKMASPGAVYFTERVIIEE